MSNTRRSMIIIAAAVLAVLVMPFTLHGDLIFVHGGPFRLAYQGVWDIYGASGAGDIARTGTTYYPPMVFYGMAAAEWILKPLAWGYESWMQRVVDAGSMAHALNGFERLDIWRWILLMKLPFLLAHAALLVWISRIADPIRRSLAVTVWVLNPVLFFTNYIFGQYRVLSILPALGVLTCLGKGKRDHAAVFYGVLLLSETYPIFILPAVAIACGRSWPERLRFIGIAFAVAGAVLVPLAIHSHGTVFYAYFSPLYYKAAARGITRHHAEIVNAVCKLILVAGAAAVWFRLLKTRRQLFSDPDLAARFAASALCLLLLLLATGQTSVHYPLWTAAFWIYLEISGRIPWGRGWSAAFWGLPILFNLDTRALNLGLLEPLRPGYFIQLPSLHEYMDQWLYWGGVIGSARLLFSAAALFMAWRLWRESLIE